MSLIPFPDHEYLLNLGRLVQAVGYLEWSVLGDLPRFTELPPSLLEKVAGRTTQQIGERLLSPKLLEAVEDVQLREWLRAAGAELMAIGRERNRVLHARPATDEASRQRLARWHPKDNDYAWITDEHLADLLAEIDRVLNRLDELNPSR